MQSELFDNKIVMECGEALHLIKQYFRDHLPLFSLSGEYEHSTGQWGLRYHYSNHYIFISSDRGFLESEVVLYGKPISLLDYDARMKEVKVSSKKNILFTLNTLKELLSQQL